MASPIAKYKAEPIISLITGYQRYVSKAENLDIHVESRKTPLSRHFKLYKVKGKEKLGQYVGNHQIINRYHNVEGISEKQEIQMNSVFQGKFTQRSQKLLNSIASRYQRPSTYSGTAVPVINVPAGEEQTKAIGGAGQDTRGRPVGGAQGIDIKESYGNLQVTTQRLNQMGHHSIHSAGQVGKTLQDNIKSIKENNVDSEDRDKKIAQEGYTYFQDRMTEWNVILKNIQFDKKRMTASAVRTSVSKGTQSNIQSTAVNGFKDMVANNTGFMSENAGQITSTALGNIGDFGQGVSYSFVIDDFKHAILQKFTMKRGKDGLAWDRSALKKDLTEVVYGYMATDGYDSVNMGVGYDNDSAAVRSFAQTALMGNKNTINTEIMSAYSLNSSALKTNAGTLQADIDLIHANKELARHIRDELLPSIKYQLGQDSKKFSRQLLGKPVDMSQGILQANRKAKIWAAPYLSVADYSYQAFGSGFKFDK